MAAAKTTAAAAGKARKVKVRATRTGFYGLKRRREGNTFTYELKDGEELPSWVVPVASNTPEVTTTAKDEMLRLRDEAARTTDEDEDGI